MSSDAYDSEDQDDHEPWPPGDFLPDGSAEAAAEADERNSRYEARAAATDPLDPHALWEWEAGEVPDRDPEEG